MEAEAVPSIVENAYERIAVGSVEGDAVEASKDILAGGNVHRGVLGVSREGAKVLRSSEAQKAH